MSPALKYTLGRLGLFLAVFLMLLPVPNLSLLVKALVALLVSLPVAWFLLRDWRDQASVAIAEGIQRRKARREELRSALAGDDEPTDRAPDERAPDERAPDERAPDERAPDERAPDERPSGGR